MFRTALAFVAAVVLALAVPPRSAAADDASGEVPFINAATAFSQQAKLAEAIDPEVFVHDEAAAPGTGPQRVEHVAGLRPARLDDEPQQRLFGADGAPLALSFGHWLAAQGTVTIEPQPDGHDRVVAVFKSLVAFGEYSLFVERTGADADASMGAGAGGSGPASTYRPLDGEGSANSFRAHVDGSAGIVIDTPQPLNGGDAIVLVYHSDSREHGASRGQIGITAHAQLVASVP
jgi:hypothetical protein